MRPIAEPAVVGTSYKYFMYSAGDLVGIDALTQQWSLRPVLNGLALLWGNDLRLRVRIERAGGPNEIITTGYRFTLDTEYDVAAVTDANADTFSIRINGTGVLSNRPFGADFTHTYGLSFSDNWSTNASRVLNDVRMINAACATESTPPVAELTAPPPFGTGCTCDDPLITGMGAGRADMNRDRFVKAADIDGFVNCPINGDCP
jgi:hypothetical protein